MSKKSEHTAELRRAGLIRQKRQLLGMTQKEVADWICFNFKDFRISQQRISKIEQGRSMQGTEVFLLADCLGLTVEELRCFRDRD